jgi:hypothetical protein
MEEGCWCYCWWWLPSCEIITKTIGRKREEHRKSHRKTEASFV